MTDPVHPRSGKAAVLSRAPLFAGVPPDDLARLATLARALSFESGGVIFRKGDLNRAIYVIERGRVKISTGSPEGREVILNLLGPSAVFGEVALIDSGARTADAIAHERVDLLALDRRDIIPFLESQPSLMLRMLETMTARLRWVSERHEDALFMELPARLAKRLLMLGEEFGFDSPRGRRLTIDLPQRELAAYMGVSRESVNRLMQDWLARGLIAMDRGVLILADRPTLRAIAGLDVKP